MDFEIAVTDAILVTDTASRHYGFPRMVRACNRDLLLFYRAGTTHAYDDAVIEMRRGVLVGCADSPKVRGGVQRSQSRRHCNRERTRYPVGIAVSVRAESAPSLLVVDLR